ncbi:carbapenem self-resistance protein CarG family protein [Zooshikella harenae]|uniref:Uncharacterized protein n=1 Tax=Zooshikella harenae TaxID=2827238 RepID=A0ABS5ZDZ7_9GAMM|nr:hypothetical protein [Zooshikella harenae]MBU2712292.1 hypothetical protein [Zooshikella harenae]
MKIFLRFVIIFLYIFSMFSTASEFKIITLRSGVNQFDLNEDGEKDIVFKAMYENNTSFANYTYSFYMKTNYNEFVHVPVGKDFSSITYWDGRLSGIGYLYQDLRVIKFKSTFILVIAQKEDLGSFEREKVLFDFYSLTKGVDHPGQLPYQWLKYNTRYTENKYYSVDEAFIEVDDQDFFFHNINSDKSTLIQK